MARAVPLQGTSRRFESCCLHMIKNLLLRVKDWFTSDSKGYIEVNRNGCRRVTDAESYLEDAGFFNDEIDSDASQADSKASLDSSNSRLE